MKKLFQKLTVLILLPVLLLSACARTEQNDVQATIAPSQMLEVSFIDVGQADAALITLDGHAMLVDGGNVEDGQDVVKFIKSKGISHLDYVLATHAHEDHSGGLAEVVNAFSVGKVFAAVDEYSSDCYKKFVEAANKKCGGITLLRRGDSFSLSSASANVLWPEEPLDSTTNNTSIVFRLEYGNTKFMFTGDIQSECESKLDLSMLSANVLKVAHHGSDSSSSYMFLRYCLPQYAVISCGEGNSYGHPHQVTLDKLESAEAQILRTDKLGTIVISTDGSTLSVRTGDEEFSSEAHEGTAGFDVAEARYIGNKSSKKFHLPSCKNLPSEANSVEFSSREEAISAGYEPCKNCNA